MSEQEQRSTGVAAPDSTAPAVVVEELGPISVTPGNGGNGDGSIARTNPQVVENREADMKLVVIRKLPVRGSDGESSANGASAFLRRGPPGRAPIFLPIQGRGGRVVACGSFATSVIMREDGRVWMIPGELKGEDAKGPLNIRRSDLAKTWNSLGVTHAVLLRPVKAVDGQLRSSSLAAHVTPDLRRLAGLVQAWVMAVIYSRLRLILEWFHAWAKIGSYVMGLVKKLTTQPPFTPPVGGHQVCGVHGGPNFTGRTKIRIRAPMVTDIHEEIDGRKRADCRGSWEVLVMPEVQDAPNGVGSSSDQQPRGHAAEANVVVENHQEAEGNHEPDSTTPDGAHDGDEEDQTIPPAKKPRMERE